MRFDVENKICDEHGPRVDSFAMPQQIAYDIMNEVSTKHTSCPKIILLACPVPPIQTVWEVSGTDKPYLYNSYSLLHPVM